MKLNKTQNSDAYNGLKLLPDGCVNTCVTSPPYWALRDYGIEPIEWPEVEYVLFGFPIKIPAVKCCLGLETTSEAFIGHMVFLFREVKRVLREDGTLWLNIGDTYAGSYKGKKDKSKHLQDTNKGSRENVNIPFFYSDSYKQKDLIGIPWMLAFALRADGWYLRQDIIWNKPNPMPENVNDRCTKAHEYIFLLTKSRKYYYDAEVIKETASNNTHARQSRVKERHKSIPRDKTNGIRPRKMPQVAGWDKGKGSHNKLLGNYPKIKDNLSFFAATMEMVDKRNKRSVWVEEDYYSLLEFIFEKYPEIYKEYFNVNSDVWPVSPESMPEAHFATFPQKLIEPCIKAGCPVGGIVLDPFHGSGTTGIVSNKLDRNFYAFEQSGEYIKIENRRRHKELGMFQKVESKIRV